MMMIVSNTLFWQNVIGFSLCGLVDCIHGIRAGRRITKNIST